MTKARDISSLIGSSGQIDNTKITLDANEIPNLDANKIATGSLGTDRIPNLSADKITSGTFADARLSQSSVQQHATSFDDNKIVNDISTLALRQASDENKSAYNTGSSSVDVFQDATGIDTTTNVSRNASEYVDTNNIQTESSVVAFPDSGYVGVSANAIRPTDNSNWTCECWFRTTDVGSDTYQGIVGSGLDFYGYNAQLSEGGSNFRQFIGNGSWQLSENEGTLSALGITANTWHHFAITKFPDGATPRWEMYIDGTNYGSHGRNVSENSSYLYWGISQLTNRTFDGYMTQFRVSNSRRYSSNFTPSTNSFTSDANTLLLINSNTTNGSTTFADSSSNGYTVSTFGSGIEHSTAVTSPISDNVLSATGNFTGTTITAPSSVSEMGAIITYQDNAGTNALNTDIVLQLSADGGSNYSTATLTALPDFSTGIKMAKVNDLAVTAGTSLKYKINFANQASGSKEARIRGVALQY